MSLRGSREFDKKLHSLLKTRVYSLKARVWPRIGKPPQVTRSRLKKTIRELQDLATETLLKAESSKRIFSEYQHKKQWHLKRGKPLRKTAKKAAFKKWYEKHVTTRNCVYVFWQIKRGNRPKCLYVGRTINGKHRPIAHFKRRWFGKATRIDVYGFDRKRGVPRFECMKTHRYNPTQSKIIPARKKYYARCPICETNRAIKSEIKDLFRLR